MRVRRRLAAIALLTMTSACGSPKPPSAPPTTVTVIDDAQTGAGLDRFDFIGRWEHVHGIRDGRTDGTSARSEYPGDSFVIAFSGYRFRLYGVTGPNGGRGILDLDKNGRNVKLNFRSPRKRAHALLYTSPVLAQGLHAIAVLVDVPWSRSAARAYVNIDSLEVDSHDVAQ